MVDAVHFAATCVILAVCWRDMAQATLLTAFVALIRFSIWPKALGWFAFGFVFASLAEIVQVWAGVYRYAQACPLVIPYYNFLLWGAVLCLASSLLQQLEPDPFTPSWKELAVEGALYALVTLLLCVWARHSQMVAAIFAAILVLRFLRFYRRGDGRFLLVGMLAGPLVESWLVGLGMYRFADPALYNLPLWHPLYWGIIVLFLRRLVAAPQRMAAAVARPTLKCMLP